MQKLTTQIGPKNLHDDPEKLTRADVPPVQGAFLGEEGQGLMVLTQHWPDQIRRDRVVVPIEEMFKLVAVIQKQILLAHQQEQAAKAAEDAKPKLVLP